MSSGQIIFLNGPSSAGKTSLAHALQGVLDEPYLLISVDDALRMLPPRFRDWSNPANYGPIYRAISGLHHCVAALAASGNNIIVDFIVDRDIKRIHITDVESATVE